MIQFDIPKEKSSIIKVFGVGGGGSNAVTHMYSLGIEGVNYVICNTDNQALETSDVPNKIQLGSNLRGGLGAGSKPQIGREATEEAIDKLEEILQTNTKMVFITAGMGGGTGTGGAPVVARLAKDMGILTVGIVTTPFGFEGKKRKLQAEEGIKELKDEVDALLVISNDKLREIYGNLKMSEAFAKADDILTVAAKGIAEIITKIGHINVDFEDVNTVMRDSGVALMGIGHASGDNRAIDAVEEALSSPLLNDNNIIGAKNVLLNISYGAEEMSMDEMDTITSYIQEAISVEYDNIIFGVSEDNSLQDDVRVTIIATGFESNEQRKLREEKENKVIHHLDEAPIKSNLRKENNKEDDSSPTSTDPTSVFVTYNKEPQPQNESEAKQFTFEFQPIDSSRQDANEEIVEPEYKETEEVKRPISNAEPITDKFDLAPKQTVQSHNPVNTKKTTQAYNQEHNERLERLKSFSLRFKNEETIEELEKQPAYKRKNINLNDTKTESDQQISRYSLGDSKNGELNLGKNSFLHDNVD